MMSTETQSRVLPPLGHDEKFEIWIRALRRTIEGTEDFKGHIGRFDSEVVEEDLQSLMSLARTLQDVACERCGGTGVRCYPNTSTWRGGIGGQAITPDVCDRCWGSGKKDCPFPGPKDRDEVTSVKVDAPEGPVTIVLPTTVDRDSVFVICRVDSSDNEVTIKVPTSEKIVGDVPESGIKFDPVTDRAQWEAKVGHTTVFADATSKIVYLVVDQGTHREHHMPALIPGYARALGDALRQAADHAEGAL